MEKRKFPDYSYFMREISVPGGAYSRASFSSRAARWAS